LFVGEEGTEGTGEKEQCPPSSHPSTHSPVIHHHRDTPVKHPHTRTRRGSQCSPLSSTNIDKREGTQNAAIQKETQEKNNNNKKHRRKTKHKKDKTQEEMKKKIKNKKNA
jgi:hypothetical protein